MPPDKTDPIGGLLQKQGSTIGAIFAIVLILIGPGAGFVGARYVEPPSCACPATDAKIDALAHTVTAAALADVQLRADVARLADTIGEVRKIEEQAHPRFRSPPDDGN